MLPSREVYHPCNLHWANGKKKEKIELLPDERIQFTSYVFFREKRLFIALFQY